MFELISIVISRTKYWTVVFFISESVSLAFLEAIILSFIYWLLLFLSNIMQTSVYDHITDKAPSKMFYETFYNCPIELLNLNALDLPFKIFTTFL